jgi:hypothetical protein
VYNDGLLFKAQFAATQFTIMSISYTSCLLQLKGIQSIVDSCFVHFRGDIGFWNGHGDGPTSATRSETSRDFYGAQMHLKCQSKLNYSPLLGEVQAILRT